MLEFVDVQKHHPFTREEAVNLRTTHFGVYDTDYYMPLAYNFNVVASNNKVDDYNKYFDVYNPVVTHGSAVTISGVADSYHNLPITPAGDSRVLLYLKFRVKPTTFINLTDTRRCKIYFDPTFICYNGINIAQDRGNRLLEKYPLPGDVNYATYMSSFRTPRLPQGESNNNMK